MLTENVKTEEEKQQMLRDILDGKLISVPKHVSRKGGKHHDVRAHVKKQHVTTLNEILSKPIPTNWRSK